LREWRKWIGQVGKRVQVFLSEKMEDLEVKVLNIVGKIGWGFQTGAAVD
jgi:hypothetical protein